MVVSFARRLIVVDDRNPPEDFVVIHDQNNAGNDVNRSAARDAIREARRAVRSFGYASKLIRPKDLVAKSDKVISTIHGIIQGYVCPDGARDLSLYLVPDDLDLLRGGGNPGP
jgi:hypothetical protein